MSCRTIRLFIFFCLFGHTVMKAQDTRVIDSLKNILHNLKSEKLPPGAQVSYTRDTTVVRVLCDLSTEFWGNNPDTAMYYVTEMLTLARKLGYKRGIADAYNSMGVIYWYKGDHFHELKSLKEALRLRIEAGNKEPIASTYGNLGVTYRMLGNYPEALKCQYKALKIFEEIKDTSGIAFALNNIGILYAQQKKYDDALKNYFAAMAIEKKAQHHAELGNCYNNIGNVKSYQADYPEAIRYYLLSLEEKKKIEDKFGISVVYNNLGEMYTFLNHYDEALKYTKASVNLKKEIGDREGLVHSYAGMGLVYLQQKKLPAASRYMDSALTLAKIVANPELLERCYYYTAMVDSAQGNFAGAFAHYKLHTIYRDSIMNSETARISTEQKMQYEFDKKETLTKAEQDQAKRTHEAALVAHSNERKLYIALAIILLLAVSALWSRLNLARKTRKLIDEKNEQLHKEKEEAQQLRMKAELMEIRHKIAKDLHDDIGSSLSSIAIYSEVAQKIMNGKIPEATKILVNLGEIAQDAMENMSDIVWTINPVNDKLDDIMQRLHIISAQLKETRDISVHFDVPQNIKDVRLTMEQRKNVYLIFKEAINNIAKYSDARNCHVMIKQEEGRIQISIKDDGKGFTNTTTTLGGNGLINMNKRALEMAGTLEVLSARDQGTEIKFCF